MSPLNETTTIMTMIIVTLDQQYCDGHYINQFDEVMSARYHHFHMVTTWALQPLHYITLHYKHNIHILTNFETLLPLSGARTIRITILDHHRSNQSDAY